MRQVKLGRGGLAHGRVPPPGMGRQSSVAGRNRPPPTAGLLFCRSGKGSPPGHRPGRPALDLQGGKIYWTPKGQDTPGRGLLSRANRRLRPARPPADRQDVEVLFDGLPEPIDLDPDLANRMLYGTDRGDPPRGNTVNRAPIDAAPEKRQEPEI